MQNEARMTASSTAATTTGPLRGAASSLATISLFLLTASAMLGRADAGGSFQSGHNGGALYAGGLDSNEHYVFITGITYGTSMTNRHTQEPGCFVSKFRSKKLGLHDEEHFSSRYGTGDKMQACNAISLMHDRFTDERLPKDADSFLHFLAAGTTDFEADKPSSFLMSLNPREMSKYPMEGFMYLDRMEQTHQVSYPVSLLYEVEMERGHGGPLGSIGSAYIASISTSDFSQNPHNGDLFQKSKGQPNWLKYRKYGSFFEMTLQKVKLEIDDTGAVVESAPAWVKRFQTEDDLEQPDLPQVFVAGMIALRHTPYLVVAGSTSGSGDGYGWSSPGSYDLDGFVTVINSSTGELETNIVNNDRIGTSEDDLILGICEDPHDWMSFYVVGTTGDGPAMGTPINRSDFFPGSMQGFVKKISMGKLAVAWSMSWSATNTPSDNQKPTVTAGIGCKVIAGGTLYVTGIVEDGAHVIDGDEQEHFGDNIVAMSMDSKSGTVNWIKQFGSMDGDENLARSGAMAADEFGNLIVYGDTTGSLFRQRKQNANGTGDTSALFLATLDRKDGSYDTTIVPSVEDGSTAKKDEVKGMLNGGKWTEDQIYGTGHWFDRDALGIQSGPSSASLFAGEMIYDINEDAIYMSGIAFEETTGNDDDDKVPSSNTKPSCMVTKLPLDTAYTTGFGDANGKLIGTKNVLEICNNVALHGFNDLIVVGFADSGSTFSQKVEMSGFALALDKNNLEEVDATPVLTSKPKDKIRYPIDVINDGKDVYIVSLTSTDNQISQEFNRVMEYGANLDISRNWVDVEKYGSSFYMSVSKLSLVEEMMEGVSMGKINFNTKWTKDFPINPDTDGSGNIERVFLGGAILNKSRNYLAVAGSTRGMGTGYGAAVGNDEDGYVAAIDLDTGELSRGVSRHTRREGTAVDDRVLGICSDPNDDSAFYVVGGSQGSMDAENAQTTLAPPGSTQAFLRKVDADGLSPIWTVELGAIHSSVTMPSVVPTVVNAFSCVVSGDIIYAGGTVEDGASIAKGNQPRKSRGGDDVWVGSFKTTSGNISWLRQIGSSGNDRLAARGGLAITPRGSVLVFGDTDGAFYRKRADGTGVNELFLMEISKDASHKAHVNHVKHQETAAPAPGSSGSSIPSNTQESARDSGKTGISTGGLTALLIAVVLMLVVVGCFVGQRMGCFRSSNQAVNAEKIEVKDGLITSSREKTNAPPSSSFRGGLAGVINEDNTLKDYSENLQDDEKEIV